MAINGNFEFLNGIISIWLTFIHMCELRSKSKWLGLKRIIENEQRGNSFVITHANKTHHRYGGPVYIVHLTECMEWGKTSKHIPSEHKLLSRCSHFTHFHSYARSFVRVHWLLCAAFFSRHRKFYYCKKANLCECEWICLKFIRHKHQYVFFIFLFLAFFQSPKILPIRWTNANMNLNIFKKRSRCKIFAVWW